MPYELVLPPRGWEIIVISKSSETGSRIKTGTEIWHGRYVQHVEFLGPWKDAAKYLLSRISWDPFEWEKTFNALHHCTKCITKHGDKFTSLNILFQIRKSNIRYLYVKFNNNMFCLSTCIKISALLLRYSTMANSWELVEKWGFGEASLDFIYSVSYMK